jgi:hypothetical protein
MGDFLLIVGTTWAAARLYLEQVVRGMEGSVESVSMARGEATFAGENRVKAIQGDRVHQVRGLEPTRIWVVGPHRIELPQEMREWLGQQGDKVRHLG